MEFNDIDEELAYRAGLDRGYMQAIDDSKPSNSGTIFAWAWGILAPIAAWILGYGTVW